MGPNLTKFLHSVEESVPFNVLKLELRYHNPFWNASVLSEGGVSQFGKFGHKIGFHGTIP